MKRITRGQFLGYGAALAGVGAVARHQLARDRRSPGARRPARPARRRSRPHRRQRARLYDRPVLPRAEAFAVEERPLHRRRIDCRHPQSCERANARHRRRAGDGHPGVHRHALPCERRERALQRERQRPSRPRTAGQPQDQGRQDARRHVGERGDVRRHQARRAAHAPTSRRSLEGSSDRRRAPRRPHELVQHQGARARGHHEGHERSRARPLLPRRDWRAHGPGGRARPQRLQQGRHARDVHRRISSGSAAATACATSRSC